MLSAGMMQTIIEWCHNQLNHPKFTTLCRSLKSHIYIWELEQAKLKKMYTDLKCDICRSTVLLRKRPRSSHIKRLEIFERIQTDLTQVAFGDHGEILSKRGYRWVLTVLDCFWEVYNNRNSPHPLKQMYSHYNQYLLKKSQSIANFQI